MIFEEVGQNVAPAVNVKNMSKTGVSFLGIQEIMPDNDTKSKISDQSVDAKAEGRLNVNQKNKIELKTTRNLTLTHNTPGSYMEHGTVHEVSPDASAI